MQIFLNYHLAYFFAWPLETIKSGQIKDLNVYLLLYQSLYDLISPFGHNLISVLGLTNPLGHRLIQALVLISHLKFYTILLILLCLTAPF